LAIGFILAKVCLQAIYYKPLQKIFIMKQLFFSLFTIMVLGSCNQRIGSGNIVTEKRQTGNFSGISVGGAFEVEVKTGPETIVEVESDDNVIHFIETKVSGDILKIRTKDGTNFNNAHFKVFVTAPEINSMNVSGAANMKATGQLTSAQKISVDVSGAGNIKAIVDAPEVYAELSGAGNIDLSGRTRNYTAKVSGSGDLKSGNLQSENTDVRVSGAGTARVHASVTLNADVSGAGNIYYKGGATVQQKKSGAGIIKNEN
jgi:Putative auto-transporter adhesin, head GIN domain